MRTRHICPKCKGNQLLFVKKLDFSCWRIANALSAEEQIDLVRRDVTSALLIDDGRGAMQAYICRPCGFTELYTIDPDTIQADGEHVVEITGPEGAPYR